ncbi:MAG: benzoate-CoA ligase family protein [Solirubrobacterales bacterium]|nr:benzoate-CoA ligase family protein [Solirubrobacterales bacterium]
MSTVTIRELPERYNACEILDHNLEAGRGERLAVHCGSQTVTYAELAARTQAFAAALREVGVRREERVLLILDDTPAWPTAFLGAMRIGAVPVPVAFLDNPQNFAHYLRDSYAQVVVVESAVADKLATVLDELPSRPRVWSANGEGEGADPLEELLAEHAGAEVTTLDTHRDDMAFWLYSSGSTGKPKGVVHLHHDIPYTCQTYARHILEIDESDTTLSTTKLYHAYGMGNSLSFPYSVGASTILLPGRANPQGTLATAAELRPTLFFSVPTLYNAMLNLPDAGDYDLSSVRRCASAAEPLSPTVLRRWREAFGLEILDGIGSTEMLHIYCSNRPGQIVPGTSGQPVPGYELELLDEDGHQVPEGEVGNLHVRGDSAHAFYWHQHEKTKAAVKGDWFFTGDRYRRAEEGGYVYEGRADDMIKVGGLWVSPIEVEYALSEHPVVIEAAVVGVNKDETTRLKAYLVCREREGPREELEAELQQWCKERLRRYEYPHLFEFVEDLPKTLTGKIQRYKLRESAQN